MRLRRTRSCLLAIALLAAALAIGACGSNDDNGGQASTGASAKQVKIDVGTGTPLVVDTDKPKVAYFWTSGDTHVVANRKGVEDEAKRRGLDLTVFDAKFDPLRQVEQIQNAMQRDEFDAFIVIPLDGDTLCPILTRQAPQKNIAVVTQDITMCGHITNEGDDAWVPGTLAQAGYPPAVDVNEQYFREVARRAGPGTHVAALLLGPNGNSASTSSEKALDQVAGELPNLDVKYKVNTNFSAPDGFARTQTMRQANPEIDTVMTIYTDLSLGAVRAIQSAGRKGEVKVYDMGGSSVAADAVRRGDFEFTTAFRAYSYGAAAITAIADAFEGKRIQRYYGGYPEGSTVEHNGQRLIVDKSNVDSYRPEY
jgi:ribose transport system substrate-binding protein